MYKIIQINMRNVQDLKDLSYSPDRRAQNREKDVFDVLLRKWISWPIEKMHAVFENSFPRVKDAFFLNNYS